MQRLKVRRDSLSLTLQPHPTTTAAAAAGTPLPKLIFIIHYASISNSIADNCLFAAELKSVTVVLRRCPNCNFPKLKSVTSIYTHVIPALALVFSSGNAEHAEGSFQLVFEGWGCVALFVLHMREREIQREWRWLRHSYII